MAGALRRSLAVAAALGITLSGPSLALAHGHAHHEASEHAVQHAEHHETASAGERVVKAGDSHQEHAHPRLEPQQIVRVTVAPAVLHTTLVTLELGASLLVVDAEPPVPNASPPPTPYVAPSQSRAPPTL